MSNRLTQTPSCWFAECKYCAVTNGGHERELLDKARKLCKFHDQYRFADFLTAEFDRLDHAVLNPTGQVEILSAVHEKTGCPCLAETTTKVAEQTHIPQVTLRIPVTYQTPTNAPNHPTSDNPNNSNNSTNSDNSPDPDNSPNPDKSPIQGKSPIRDKSGKSPQNSQHRPRTSTIFDRLKVGPTLPRSTR